MQRQWMIVVLGIASGCGFRSNAAGGDAAPPSDAATDSMTDAPIDAQSGICVGRFVVVCRPTAPANNANIAFLSPTTVNTDADTRCVMQSQGAGVPTLCVMTAHDIRVDAAITVVGSHPLVLAAYHDLTIAMKGNLILTSATGSSPGAGANDPACHAPTAGGNGTTGAGGGAGGSFGGTGGSGGTGDMGGSATAGMAGAPITPILRVTGGCQGSKGGDAGAASGGAPGNGGGAVMLIAKNKLTIDGVITSGGGGGNAPTALSINAGGGGGGSGGFVGLDALTYAIKGLVAANGGGGASGAAATPGLPGGDGIGSTTVTASGGTSLGGGAGGSGSIATMLNGAPGLNATNGGGGGGGGAGMILVKSTAPTGNGSYSPPFTLVP